MAGNVATYDGAMELIAMRSGRDQGWHRAGFDLHHAHGDGRGHAADDRDCGGVSGGAKMRMCRSSPMAASSFPATSPRRMAAGASAVMIGSLFAGDGRKPRRD